MFQRKKCEPVSHSARGTVDFSAQLTATQLLSAVYCLKIKQLFKENKTLETTQKSDIYKELAKKPQKYTLGELIECKCNSIF